MVKAAVQRRKAAVKGKERRRDGAEEEEDAEDVPTTPGRGIFPSSSFSDITSDSDAWSSDEGVAERKRKSKLYFVSRPSFSARV